MQGVIPPLHEMVRVSAQGDTSDRLYIITYYKHKLYIIPNNKHSKYFTQAIWVSHFTKSPQLSVGFKLELVPQ